MRAQLLQRLDGPDGLELVTLPDPEPSEDCVIIDVRAAGVSFPELLYTYGKYQDKRPPPFIPGVEVAGIVRSAPAGAAFSPGDRVAAVSFYGGFGERVSASLDFTFRLPDDLSFAEGAGLVLNYQTAYFGLSYRGGVQPGETVAVHGAAGGLGSAALQVIRGLGATPIAIVSTPEKREFLRTVTDTEAVILSPNWAAEVKEFAGVTGVNAVFDPVGGDRFADSLRVLAPEGRVIVVGFADGAIPEIKVNRLLLRNISVIGAAWGDFAKANPEVARTIGLALDDMATAGVVRPAVGPRFSLEQAPDALREVESRRAFGKVILEFP